MRPTLLLTVILALGCGLGGKDDEEDEEDEDTFDPFGGSGDDDSGDTGGADDTADTGETADSDDPPDSQDESGSTDEDAPTIDSVDTVTCTKYQSAGEVWSFQLSVSDPQGPSSVTGGDVAVLARDGGAELATYSISCSSGVCLGTFRAAYDDITCAIAPQILLRFVVEDEDGHASVPVEYAPS